MNTISTRACKFIRELMRKYLMDQDYDAMKRVLHKNITCIGSGIDEIWHNFDDALTKIEILSKFEKIDFAILDDWYEAEQLNDTDQVVYGEVDLEKKLANGEKTQVRFRISAICRFKHEQFWIMHMHFSLPLSAQIQQKDADISIREHRSQLADKVQELLDLTNSIQGGVEICDIDDGYTIHYLSEGFAELLGYKETELNKLIGKPHRSLIYATEDEYTKLVQSVDEQLSQADNYAIEYKMLQKNGNYLWVLENGTIVDDKGVKRLRCLVVDISKQKRQEEELELSKIRYELAVKATKVQMFEFNVETQDIHMFPGQAQSFGIPTLLKDAGEELISYGIVSPSSVDILRKVFKNVTNGSASEECDIALKTEGDGYTSYHLGLSTGFSEEGKPLFAVGVLSSIQEIVTLKRESQFSKTLLHNRDVGTFEVNITTNELRGDSSKKTSAFFSSVTGCYSDLLQIFIDTQVHVDYKEALHASLSIDTLKRITNFDETAASVQYRRIDTDGDYRWWSINGRLFVDSQTNEVKAYFYEENINDKKEQELTLQFDAEHDTMTGLFNKASTEKYIRQYLSDKNNTYQTHALFVIDLDYFKAINDTFGHVYGDEVLIEATDLIHCEFRNTDIVGRIGGDECCILMKSITSIDEVREKATTLCRVLKKTYTEKDVSITISASIGIALTSESGFDYDTLFSKADENLYTSKHLGRNRYTL